MFLYFLLENLQILATWVSILYFLLERRGKDKVVFRRTGRTSVASSVAERNANADCQPLKGSRGKRVPAGSLWDSYLVVPTSSHKLVSKIKPYMSKYKHEYCETANGSLNQLSFI